MRVCLTFDFDGISLWLARGASTPGPLSRGEFAATAVTRILTLLGEKGVESTFFIPAHTLQTFPDACRAIHDAGHEIGLHGDRHEPVSTLTAAQERAVNEKGISLIEALTGARPSGHRTPSFDFSAHTVSILRDLDISYDSSLMGSDFEPYLVRTGDSDDPEGGYRFGRATDIVELPVSWTLDDYPYLEFYRSANWVMPGLHDPRAMFASFLDDVRFAAEDLEEAVVTVTLHPEVIGRGARLRALSEFIDGCLALGAEFVRCDRAAAAAKRSLLSMVGDRGSPLRSDSCGARR